MSLIILFSVSLTSCQRFLIDLGIYSHVCFDSTSHKKSLNRKCGRDLWKGKNELLRQEFNTVIMFIYFIAIKLCFVVSTQFPYNMVFIQTLACSV
jgi:hypothetical protein